MYYTKFFNLALFTLLHSFLYFCLLNAGKFQMHGQCENDHDKNRQ
jgi:hypothetical protein